MTPGATADPPLMRWGLTAVAIAFLGLFLLLPVALVFTQALAKGLGAYAAALRTPDTLAAVRLTLTIAAIAVPLNVVFGLAAAWAVAKFDFVGKGVLLALIDLPLAVSPVISGMVFVLLFGAQGLLGPFLASHSVKVIFALPGIALATIFVTFPLVARELIPAMEAAGREREEAALSLGAGGWRLLGSVTLPSVRWALLYGVVLTAARAMGEFGAVSVVSGKIRGQTNTVPLHVENLYNEYQFAAAFAVASVLTLLAAGTLLLKKTIERTVDDAD